MVNAQTSNPTLTNCWFSRNASNYLGGGIYSTIDSAPTLTNCIMWGNTAPSGGAQVYGELTSITYSCIQDGWTGVGNTSEDPLCMDADGDDDIVGTADDDLRLRAGSPCIDAGDNEADIDANTPDTQPLGDTDRDGSARFVDDPTVDPDPGNGTPPIVDMGAYEYQADCNGNEVIDSLDIDTGTSEDCNDNGVPDECDLADGSSEDLNENDIPDECEESGDLNCDWTVSIDDLQPFVLALIDPEAYALTYPDCDVNFADMNGDESIDGQDVQLFIDKLLAG
ncbi:MAG: hypothetical protein JXQ75_16850 [Phycisphaerae bacterium]|nr:hypothetical protein [Phycisphaerae bacterium]